MFILVDRVTEFDVQKLEAVIRQGASVAELRDETRKTIRGDGWRCARSVVGQGREEGHLAVLVP